MPRYHTEKEIPLDEVLNARLNRLVQGYKKEIATLKQKGEIKATEGKQPLSFQGYQTLALRFLQLKPSSSPSGNHRGPGPTAVTWSQGVFGWAFLLLQWNCMSR